MLFSKLAIAPMIDWTFPQFRYFMRILAPKALLYTEMQTIGAIGHNPQKALSYHVHERPIAIQLGGSDVKGLRESALKAEQAGFDEVNLNLGCPSDRVQSGQFGACLMKEPECVERGIRAMKQAVHIPVTAKIRIGVDDKDDYEYFENFAKRLLDAGVDKLIVHARKAWLKGLSPKQNRTIPPLHYDYAYRFKQAYPEMVVVINGNIDTQSAINAHLQKVDGVMVGRLACNQPYAIAKIHHSLYSNCPVKPRYEYLEDYIPYAQQQIRKGVRPALLLKGLFNLAHGLANGKQWKQSLMKLSKNNQSDRLENLIALMRQLETDSNGILCQDLVN